MNNCPDVFWIRVLGLMAVGGLCSPDCALSQTDATDRIFADWRDRTGHITSIILVAEGEGLLPKGCLNSFRGMSKALSEDVDYPEVDHHYRIELNARADFGNSLLWKTVCEDVPFMEEGIIGTQKVTWAFDGEKTMRVTTKDGNPHWRWKEDLPAADFEVVYLPSNAAKILLVRTDYPWLLSLGVNLIPGQAITPDRFRALPVKDSLSEYGTAEVDGRKCLVLRSKAMTGDPGHYYEFFVDTARQSTVVRFVRYEGGEVAEQFDVTMGNRDGLWLPTAWHWMSLQQGHVTKQEQIKVVSLELNPSLDKSMFVVIPGTGTVVADRSGRIDSTQIVQSDGARVDIDDAMAERRSGKWRRIGLLAILLGLAAGSCLYFLLRKRGLL